MCYAGIKELVTELIPEVDGFVEDEPGIYEFNDGKFRVQLTLNALGSRVVGWNLAKSADSIFISHWEKGEIKPELANFFGTGKHSVGMRPQIALEKWNKFKTNQEKNHE